VALAPHLQLQPIDGGWRVKTSDDGRHYIDVLRMLYNWRLVTTPVNWPTTLDRGWCYFGHGVDEHGNERTMSTAFRAAVLAGLAWDGGDSSEPAGYDKRVVA
jgi:hypothetical protein